MPRARGRIGALAIAAGLSMAAPGGAQTEVGPAYFASQKVVEGSVLKGAALAQAAFRSALREDGFTVGRRDVVCLRRDGRRFTCSIELSDWQGAGTLRPLSGPRAALRYAVESR